MKTRMGGTRNHQWTVTPNEKGSFDTFLKSKDGGSIASNEKTQELAIGMMRFHAALNQMHDDEGPLEHVVYVRKWLDENGFNDLSDKLLEVFPNAADYNQYMYKKHHELKHKHLPESYFKELREKELYFHNRLIKDMKKSDKKWEPNEHCVAQHLKRMRELTP